MIVRIEVHGQATTVRIDGDGPTLGSDPSCHVGRSDAGWSPIEGTLSLEGGRLRLETRGGEARFDLAVGERARLGDATITFEGLATPGPSSVADASSMRPARRPARRSPFDRDVTTTLSRAPWFAVSAGAHVLVAALLFLLAPLPRVLRPIDPSRQSVIEATQSPDSPGDAERTTDEVVPPEESATPFTDPEPVNADSSDAAPAPDTAPDAPPAGSPSDAPTYVPPEMTGPDRAMIGLRLKPVRPPEAPPDPTPAPVPTPAPTPVRPVNVAPTVDEEYASEINRKAAARLKTTLKDPSSGLGRAMRGVKSADLIVVSNGRAFDHLENVLDAVSIPYAQVSVAEFATRTDLSRTRLVFWNCGPPIAESSNRALVTEKIRRFVEAGGFLWTTDWALRDVVAGAFPGRLAAGEDRLHTLPELVVDVGPVAESAADPLLEGVIPPGPCRWWLEAAAAEVRVVDASKVTVLLEAPALATAAHRKSKVIAATFDAGRGRVLHVMGHAWQEKTDLDGTVGMQRLALNFVRQRLERDDPPR